MNDLSSENPQFSLRSLFALTLVIALFASCMVISNRSFYRTPCQQAVHRVWDLDGSAMQNKDGYFEVVLSGNGILVDDRICREISICDEIQKLTIVQAQITDQGMKDVSKLKNLFYLNVNGCAALTDLSVPLIGQIAGLKELHISKTGITNAGADSLRRMLPDCTIHD